MMQAESLKIWEKNQSWHIISQCKWCINLVTREFHDKDKAGKGWVDLVGWTPADGLPTWSYPSADGRACDRESLPAKTDVLTTVPCHKPRGPRPGFSFISFSLSVVFYIGCLGFCVVNCTWIQYGLVSLVPIKWLAGKIISEMTPAVLSGTLNS